jgi:hypothetical protein
MGKSKIETIREQVLGYRVAIKAVEATKPREVRIDLVPENIQEIEEKIKDKVVSATLEYDPFDNRFRLEVDGSGQRFPIYIAQPLLNALRDFIEEEHDENFRN